MLSEMLNRTFPSFLKIMKLSIKQHSSAYQCIMFKCRSTISVYYFKCNKYIHFGRQVNECYGQVRMRMALYRSRGSAYKRSLDANWKE